MSIADYVVPSRRRVRLARDEFETERYKLKADLARRFSGAMKRRQKAVREHGEPHNAPPPWSPTTTGPGGYGGFGSLGNGPLLDDDSGSLFDPIAYQTEDAIDESNWRESLRRHFKLTIQNPLAYGWIETFVQHIVGDKFQMKSLDDDPATQEAWDKQAENMAGPRATHGWPFRIQAQDTVRSALRLGDDMLMYNPNPFDGSFSMREMEPVWVYNAARIWPGPIREWTPLVMATFGVQTDPNDMDVVTSYWYDPHRNGRMIEVPASNVQHTKYNGTRRMKRGRPLLLPVIKPLIRLDKTLEARALMHLNRAEMSTWYERQEGMDPEMLKAIVDEILIKEGADKGAAFAMEPGSEEYLQGLKKVYNTPNLEAGDARWDILTQMQPIARALGLSMQTAFGITDATMATAREANLPEILMFEWAQDWFFQQSFLPEGRRCIQEKIKAGMLDPLSYEEFDEQDGPAEHNICSKGRRIVPRNTGFQGSFPKMRVPDVKALTDAVLAQRAAYIIDDEEAMTMLGYDAALMRNRVALQRREDAKHQEAEGMLEAEIKNALSVKAPYGSNGNGDRGGRSDAKAAYRHSGTKS